jgi:prephenate dehydrogenase
MKLFRIKIYHHDEFLNIIQAFEVLLFLSMIRILGKNPVRCKNND